MILLNDFKRRWAELGDEVTAAFERVGASGWYVLGQEVRGFEQALAQHLDLGHVIGVANGTDALEIALRALGCGPGDKVLTTPLSAFATTLAIQQVGAVPVFVDVDATGSIDLDRVEHALREDEGLRVFVPVHLYGHCLDLVRLERLKQEFGLKVIEDCAQAIGASREGRIAGSVGDVAAFSFYPTKNLGALGDGGACAAATEALASAIRSLRDYGQTSKYVHERRGLNSRLDEVQAALLNVFLPRLAGWNARRRDIAERYDAGIRNPLLTPVRPGQPGASVYHLYPLLVDAPEAREPFMSYAREQGVQTAIHYPILITEQGALRGSEIHCLDELSQAKDFARRVVSLPIEPGLTDAEVNRVVEVANGWGAPEEKGA